MGWLSLKGKGSFGGESGVSHCNQWGLYAYCVVVRERCTLPKLLWEFLFCFSQVHFHLFYCIPCCLSFSIVKLLNCESGAIDTYTVVPTVIGFNHCVLMNTCHCVTE